MAAGAIILGRRGKRRDEGSLVGRKKKTRVGAVLPQEVNERTTPWNVRGPRLGSKNEAEKICEMEMSEKIYMWDGCGYF